MRKVQANGRNGYAAILVTVATLLSISCGGGGGPKGTQVVPSVAGLVFNTASLDFGAVAINNSRTASVVLTNSSPAGGGSVTVTKIVVTGAGFTLSTTTGSFSLAAGQSSTVTVNFAPKSAGNALGQLSIIVAGASGSGDISLTGSTIVGSQLVVWPSKMGFGQVALGSSKTLTGTLSAGASDITISSASWNGQGYSVSGIDFPVTVHAGSSVSYSISFAPQTSGATSGGIIFLSDATNSPTTQTFSGTGGAVAQAAQHSVDLTWDLGSSGITGYNIYRGTRSGGPYTRLNSTPLASSGYTDLTVTAGTRYYYVATSLESVVESTYSDEVVAAIPSP